MAKQIEMQLDKQTILYADVTWGTAPNGRCFEVDNIKVVTWLEDSMEVDITQSLPPKYLQHYKDRFVEFVSRAVA